MQLDLTPDMATLVDRKLRSGEYRSASELVWEALQLLDQRDHAFAVDNLRKEIDEGFRSSEVGDLRDGDTVFERIDAELAALDDSGV